jgi:hypothetical protein
VLVPASFILAFFSILEIRPYSYFCQPHFHARHGRALFLVSSEIERTRNKAQSLPEWGWQKAELGSDLRRMGLISSFRQPHFHTEIRPRPYQNRAGKRLNRTLTNLRRIRLHSAQNEHENEAQFRLLSASFPQWKKGFISLWLDAA